MTQEKKKKNLFGRIGDWFKDGAGWVKNKVYLSTLVWVGRMVFGDRWKGIKGIVLGISTFVLGAWTWFETEGIADKLCGYSDQLCGLEDSAVYGVVLMIVGGLQQIVRAITDTPVDPKIPQARKLKEV